MINRHRYISALVGINNIMRGNFISLLIFVVIERLKLCFYRATYLIQSSLQSNETISSDNRKEYIFSFVENYPVESAYISNYILPSLQFTAIFEVGSNIFLVNYNNVITRGFLKATSSMSLIFLKHLESGKQLEFYKIILPFFKEPIVSTCNYILPHNLLIPKLFALPHPKKFICNLTGEVSHNLWREYFGLQELDLYSMAKSIPIKSMWKNVHQGAESWLVSLLGNPLGFYVSSFVPRSWGNQLLETITDVDQNVSIHLLYKSAQDYFFENL